MKARGRGLPADPAYDLDYRDTPLTSLGKKHSRQTPQDQNATVAGDPHNRNFLPLLLGISGAVVLGRKRASICCVNHPLGDFSFERDVDRVTNCYGAILYNLLGRRTRGKYRLACVVSIILTHLPTFSLGFVRNLFFYFFFLPFPLISHYYFLGAPWIMLFIYFFYVLIILGVAGCCCGTVDRSHSLSFWIEAQGREILI
ncbi:hypothetical protein P170DRAFT_209476 [Aspergillus steynii IBT 23096]|uniref:Uncharacterized protein n=1 Tax=Aspergillus steynii IBT 23096 TaxID=1392250 RepID=A0A2I2G5W6_9EURO|nr:uncharacterized protein P170DRAFT_209476 [Aspergillus steynii IBT 23096]PLB48271.1 hypothetical protein P170DRAFT_209476 [Aspergillus steynii IBT 23096]